jgi:hypothetical protein
LAGYLDPRAKPFNEAWHENVSRLLSLTPPIVPDVSDRAGNFDWDYLKLPVRLTYEEDLHSTPSRVAATHRNSSNSPPPPIDHQQGIQAESGILPSALFIRPPSSGGTTPALSRLSSTFHGYSFKDTQRNSFASLAQAANSPAELNLELTDSPSDQQKSIPQMLKELIAGQKG